MPAKTRKNKTAHNKTAKKRISPLYLSSHKRPWKVTYRNKNGEKTRNILKNGTEKNTFLHLFSFQTPIFINYCYFIKIIAYFLQSLIELCLNYPCYILCKLF